MKLIIYVILAFLILGLIGFFALSSGAYNIAATDKHWEITEKAIEWARESSIRTHAEKLEVPPLDDESLLITGAKHYDAMCTECHLSPGQNQTEMAMGLYPQATVFYEREPINDKTDKLEHAKKYFWVIKNGIKMSAMPAWGPSHDDDDIWAMTAFVQKLSAMTSEQYTELVNSSDGHGHDHGDHHH